MRDRRFGLSLALAVLVLFLLAPPGMAQDSVPRFVPGPCPFETETELEGVDCGELVVWENRDRHEEGTLGLAVSILRSTGENPEPDPLVFLSGGPGGRSVVHTPSRAGSEFWSRYRESRDVIFRDQRGTGYSDPDFCEELDRVYYTTRLLRDAPRPGGHAGGTRRHSQRAARRAVSARRAPMGERPLAARSIGRPRLRAVRGRRSLQPGIPRPGRALLQLARHPRGDARGLAMEDTARFPDGRLVIDGAMASVGVFAGLYDRRFIPLVPLLVREGGLQNDHVWRALADRLTDSPERASRGQYLSVECYEVAPFNPPV